MRLTPGIAEKVMKEVAMGKNAIEEIEHKIVQESTDCDDKGFPIITLWAFFNVLTWYISHRAASINHRVQMERRLRIAMRGLK
jgi:hypothetical protein